MRYNDLRKHPAQPRGDIGWYLDTFAGIARLMTAYPPGRGLASTYFDARVCPYQASVARNPGSKSTIGV